MALRDSGSPVGAMITGAAFATPPSREQADLWSGFFGPHFEGSRWARRVFAASGVVRRHPVVDPTVEDVSAWSTGARMERYLVEAMPLGKSAVSGALAAADLSPGDVGLFAVVSCTGYATPGVDIRLARDLAMNAATQRLFIGHMGCFAALPALGAVSDYVIARGRPAVLLCIELSSLHLQPPTNDLEQVVAHSLFSDAAAALVVEPDRSAGSGGVGGTSGSGGGGSGLSGSDGGGSGGGASGGSAVGGSGPFGALEGAAASGPGRALRVIATAARTDAATAELMTWDVTDLGFRMGLSRRVPDVLARHVGPMVHCLLAENGVSSEQVAGWAVHPGGPAVLDVVEDQLELPADALDESRHVLAEHGNCSSATVLLVLDEVRRRRAPEPGAYIVALAFGPGLTLYATLLQA